VKSVAAAPTLSMTAALLLAQLFRLLAQISPVKSVVLRLYYFVVLMAHGLTSRQRQFREDCFHLMNLPVSTLEIALCSSVFKNQYNGASAGVRDACQAHWIGLSVVYFVLSYLMSKTRHWRCYTKGAMELDKCTHLGIVLSIPGTPNVSLFRIWENTAKSQRGLYNYAPYHEDAWEREA
jgi:hypothetical protein